MVVGAKYDQDGIDIHFLNNRGAHRVVKVQRPSTEEMNRLTDYHFQNASDLIALRKSVGEPHKDTHSPTGDVLETLLLKYRKQISTREGRLRTKKRLFIVITDGEASKSFYRPLRVRGDTEYLDLLHKPGDSPEEGIVDAAIFLQKNEFPTSQVLDPPRISARERDQLTLVIHRRSGYSSSRLEMIKRRRGSWKSWIRASNPSWQNPSG